MPPTITQSAARPLSMNPTGMALIVLVDYFNPPYARLAAIIDYPPILRQPAETILASFHAGGPGLIVTWYGFALAAIMMMPLALANSFAGTRIARFLSGFGDLGGLDRRPCRTVAGDGPAALGDGHAGAAGDPRWRPGLTLVHAYAGTALALGSANGRFASGAIGGYLLLTIWMIVSGLGLIRRP